MHRFLTFVLLAFSLATSPGCKETPVIPTPQPSADAVVIAAITPPTSTVVAPGSRIDFAAVVSYTLVTADTGRLTLTVRDQANRNLLPPGTPEEFAITRGTTRFNVAQPVQVPMTGVTEVRISVSLFPGATTQTNTTVSVSYQVR